jgi:cellulose synthase/poly-beta-1,6-N-acetylglucosamine synthase-like glycosyltransferase
VIQGVAVLTDWVHWLTSLRPDELCFVFGPLLFIDGPRYGVSKLLMCAWDVIVALIYRPLVGDPPQRYTHCPSVCVVIPACNEGLLIAQTLQSVWGTYPQLQIIVVDEASNDETLSVAREFERTHAGVTVLPRLRRGGKSSAVNMARHYTQADVLILIDGDSVLGPQAIWEVVQPFQNPRVGVVSGMIRALNASHNLVTRLQALEYLNTILVGRILMSRLNVLGISSGAFSAYRIECYDQGKGKDVGPTEDLDLSLRIRKSGYDLEFVPTAVCYTDVPTTWKALFKQRRFWEQGSVVKLYCRKHADMMYFWQAGFRWSNLFHFLDIIIYDLLCAYAIWFYFGFLLFTQPLVLIGRVCFTLYVSYVALETMQYVSMFLYSDNWKRDWPAGLVVPLSPLYQLFLRFVSVVAITEEFLWRKSFDDGHVPPHVRQATWHW